MTFGGGYGPDVPWFTLPVPFYGPYTAPPAASSPYSNLGPSVVNSDNPWFLPSYFPGFANICRFWNTSPSYVVVIPQNVPQLPIGAPDLTTRIASTFPGLTVSPGSPAANYTWGQWSQSVQSTFTKYNKINTSAFNAIFAGDVYAKPYSLVEGAIPWNRSTYIWDVNNGGPTGNGVNEIILCDQPNFGIGLTSMLVNPATGEILECDVIFSVGATTANAQPSPFGLIQTYLPIGGPLLTTVPEEWTALDHEIGHFIGLDHTNLHPGVTAPPIGTALPINNFGSFAVPGSRAVYPAALPTPLTQPPFPMMVGRITHLGTAINVTTLPVHNDEVTGISKLYPVFMPLPLSSKFPLINVTASIRGQYRTVVGPAPVGAFGRNVYIVSTPLLDAVGGFPLNGVISSTARLSWDPLLATMIPTASIPSVVGAGVAGSLGTGDFAIEGIPAETIPSSGINGTPLVYDVLFENSLLLGVAFGNQAEWFSPAGGGGAYGGNPLGAFPLAQNRTSVAMTSQENVSSTPPTPLPPLPTGSLSVLRGTVIYLQPNETSDPNLGAMTIPGVAGTNTPTPVSPLGPRFREQVARPLVDIQPRFGRTPTLTGNVVVTVRMSDPNFTYNLATATLLLNGSPFSLAPFPPVTTPAAPGPIITGPAVSVWTIPELALLGTMPPSTPAQLTFTIIAGPGLVDTVTSAPIISAVGRNDVIL